MDGSQETQSWLLWVLGAIMTGTLAAIGYINTRISSVEKKAGDDDDKIWAAHETERAKNSEFREQFTGKVAALPTKDDLNQMESRIMSAIRGRG